jgi:hypothetical protein
VTGERSCQRGRPVVDHAPGNGGVHGGRARSVERTGAMMQLGWHPGLHEPLSVLDAFVAERMKIIYIG